MSKPENFILNTDYPTLKNDDVGTVSISIPASIVIDAGDYWSSSQTIDIGTSGSVIRSTIKSSRNNKEYVSSTIAEGLYASAPSGVVYYLSIDVYRTSPTQITVYASIVNTVFPSSIMQTSSTAETITVKLATFLSPFN